MGGQANGQADEVIPGDHMKNEPASAVVTYVRFRVIPITF